MHRHMPVERQVYTVCIANRVDNVSRLPHRKALSHTFRSVAGSTLFEGSVGDLHPTLFIAPLSINSRATCRKSAECWSRSNLDRTRKHLYSNTYTATRMPSHHLKKKTQ